MTHKLINYNKPIEKKIVISLDNMGKFKAEVGGMHFIEALTVLIGTAMQILNQMNEQQSMLINPNAVHGDNNGDKKE